MVLPNVITLQQKLDRVVYDSLLYLTITLCFSVHKARNKKMEREMVIQFDNYNVR
jgi:hypothetical protein